MPTKKITIKKIKINGMEVALTDADKELLTKCMYLHTKKFGVSYGFFQHLASGEYADANK